MKTEIYRAPDGYHIIADDQTAQLIHQGQTRTTTITPAKPMPPFWRAQLKKAGQDPNAFFFVGDELTGRATVLRSSARAAWDEHVAKTQANADKRLADEMKLTTPALVLAGHYGIEAQLAHARPATPAETQLVSSGFAKDLVVVVVHRRLNRAAVRDWMDQASLGRARHHTAQDSPVWFLDPDQVKSLLDASNKRARQEIKCAREAAYKEMRDKARRTGKPVEIERFMAQADGSDPENSTDLIQVFIRPDGTTYTRITETF
jgi:hypothetical protein